MTLPFSIPYANKSMLSSLLPTQRLHFPFLRKTKQILKWRLVKSWMLKAAPTSCEVHLSLIKVPAGFSESEAKLKPWRISLLFLFTLPIYFSGEDVSIGPGCPLCSTDRWWSDGQKLMQPWFLTPSEKPEANFHLSVLAASCSLLLPHHVAL